MNKNELIAAMADSAGITKVDARKALDGFIKVVARQLSKGDKIAITGFGCFSVAERSERNGVDPSNGQKMVIPRKRVVKFKAGAQLADRVKG